MPLGRIALAASILGLLLVATVPVDAAPPLQTETHSSYSLTASISSLQTCVTLVQGSAIGCPLIAVCNAGVGNCGMSTDIDGTIGWTVTDLTGTTLFLNVTRDLAISNRDSTRPVVRNIGSFNESIDLASRLVSLFPGIMPEMDQFLQLAQTTASSSLAGINLTASMPTLESMIPHRQLFTMWWVNGPLKLNETIPVLALPANVTRSSNIVLGGSIGSRDAWTLDFNLSRPLILSDPSASVPSIPSESTQVGFVFNYDKTSDMLLSANAEVQFGFGSEIAIPPSPCDPSASMVCPATTSPTIIMNNFGVSIEASLKLSNTTVDLSHRMTLTIPPQDNGGSQSSVGSNNGNGSGTSNGSESNSGTSGVGSRSNSNGAPGNAGQPSSNSNQPRYGALGFSWTSWIYALLVVIAVVIIGSALWISRRRSRKLLSDN